MYIRGEWMLEIIKRINNFSREISKFKTMEKSKLMSVSINICCIFTMLIIVMLLKFVIHISLYNLLELPMNSILEVVIITLEILLCTQVGSYAFNKSESVGLHVPYALIASLIINILLEGYKLLKLFDVKSQIASLLNTTNTLTVINIEIVLLVAIIIGEIILGTYIYSRYILGDTKGVSNEEKS